MKASSLVLPMAILIVAEPATASIMSFGSSYARSCYLSAEARRASIEALATCDRAFETQPMTDEDRVATHVNRGILKMIRGDDAAAMADFDRALSLDEHQAEAWLNKAVVLLRRGDSPTAFDFAQRAIDLKTRRPSLAYYVRAIANEDAGRLSAAYADLRRASELEPGWSLPRQELTRYRVRR